MTDVMNRFIFLIPTHNRADLLKRTIASVLNNEYSETVLYICNDGSTDHVAEVEKHYTHNKKVRWTNLTNNQGTNKARNTLLDQIAQDKEEGFVCFMDDDDVLIPHALKHANALINEHPHYAWYIGHQVDKEGNKLSIIKKYGEHVFVKSSFVNNTIWGDPFHMVHTRVISQDDRFTTLVKNAEEWYFYCRIAMKNNLFAFDFTVCEKEFLPTGLSTVGYNADGADRVIVSQLKLDTLSKPMAGSHVDELSVAFSPSAYQKSSIC